VQDRGVSADPAAVVADRTGDDGEGTMIPVQFKIDDPMGNTSIWFVAWGPPPPRTWLGWKLLKLRVFGYRMRDAWLVLRGKAWIDE
jgi:hypothetical protein